MQQSTDDGDALATLVKELSDLVKELKEMFRVDDDFEDITEHED